MACLYCNANSTTKDGREYKYCYKCDLKRKNSDLGVAHQSELNHFKNEPVANMNQRLDRLDEDIRSIKNLLANSYKELEYMKNVFAKLVEMRS